MNKQLSGTVTIVAGGNTPIGAGIVKTFLLHNAFVIAPLSTAEEIIQLRSSLSSVQTGQLITLLHDPLDYRKAEDIKECIKQVYGHVDLVVSAFDNNWHGRALLDIEIDEWQKAIDENITAHFIINRVALKLMKEQHKGMYINICNADVLCARPYASLTRLITENQTELSVMLAEEVKHYNIRYYHLFLHNIVTGQPLSEQTYPDLTTPLMTGEHIIKLYHHQLHNTDQLFQYYPAAVAAG
ncbi:NAD(P)-dependent dehydrogenase, short-chain alcohol dehydrogenase family [Filimonas lacunae]|uniref:NAD(P)-dependent dehydrogenase, short-chain alcohol dehydrogenase family n=1 Tax=Filimonas lacunae TaxID=477680 RepID=A0A173MAC5_9BACT|nr:SDR family NAD(P)-dependent oxidoreductase [Filimonas lacunae]BAV04487.1 hypothetical protein FLA_0479 [Filimonas lacunae]SIT31559.1 NAD(P)-dependent dehydrogenase, short-chain alcohol dehydrogenase family [Filimonas lacunae]